MMIQGEPTYLPDNYSPPSDVAVLGRGKRFLKHEGNRRLRELVQKELPAYLAAFNRKDKSAIILRVLQKMRGTSSDNIGLVRYDTLSGKWTLVDDGTARVSIAQIFRDALSVYYKSSRQHKQKLRRENKLKRSVSSESESSQDGSVASSSSSAVKRAIRRHKQLEAASASACNTAGPMAKERLSSVLQQCRAAVDEDGEGSFASAPGPIATAQPQEVQIFDSLFQVFCSEVDMADNPFEPTPLKEVVATVVAPAPIMDFPLEGKTPSTETISLRDVFLFGV